MLWLVSRRAARVTDNGNKVEEWRCADAMAGHRHRGQAIHGLGGTHRPDKGDLGLGRVDGVTESAEAGCLVHVGSLELAALGLGLVVDAIAGGRHDLEACLGDGLGADLTEAIALTLQALQSGLHLTEL